MGKYKLKCFQCGHPFKNRAEVWRGMDGEPICEDCMGDHASDCDDSDWLFDTIKLNGKDARRVPLDVCIGGCHNLVYHPIDQSAICYSCDKRIDDANDEEDDSWLLSFSFYINEDDW